MRHWLRSAALLALALSAHAASAAPVVDPQTGFAMDLAARRANSCFIVPPGNDASCTSQSEQARAAWHSEDTELVAAAVHRFEGWSAHAYLLRHPATAEYDRVDVEALEESARERGARAGIDYDLAARVRRSSGLQTICLRSRRETYDDTQTSLDCMILTAGGRYRLLVTGPLKHDDEVVAYTAEALSTARGIRAAPSRQTEIQTIQRQVDLAVCAGALVLTCIVGVLLYAMLRWKRKRDVARAAQADAPRR